MGDKKTSLTKRFMKEAFVAIAKTTPIAKIGVSDICREAELNRSTFYAHYDNVDQLFDEMEEEFIEHIPVLNQAMTDRKVLEEVHNYTEFINKHPDAFRVLVHNGRITGKFSSYWKQQQALQNMEDMSLKDREAFELTSVYTVSGITSLYMEWIDHGKYLSPEDVAQMVLKIYRETSEI